jgi:hypothetical protein
MKNMYKGVLTIAIATVVASAAIMISGKEINTNTVQANDASVATENDSKTTATISQKNTASTAIVTQASDTVKKMTDPTTSSTAKGVVAVAATGATVVATTSDKATSDNTTEETEIKAKKAPVNIEQKQNIETTAKAPVANTAEISDSNYPPPPPGPFAEKKKAKTTESAIMEKPAAPTVPDAVAVPKAPVAPATIASEAAPSINNTEKAKIKAPDSPVAELTTPITPKEASSHIADDKIDVVTDSKKLMQGKESISEKSKALQLLEDETGRSKTAVVKTTAVEAVTAGAAVKATNTGSDLKTPEPPKDGQLNTPDAPAKMQAPDKPEIAELKAPETPDSLKAGINISKPAEMHEVNMDKLVRKNIGTQMPVMPPQGIMMPQGMPLMMPPPQMLNGQRIIMVPVYPVNIGGPMMPNGYQMPFGMPPQGNIQQKQPQQPDFSQQIPVKTPIKAESLPK